MSDWNLDEILQKVVGYGGTDIFLIVGAPVSYKKMGVITQLSEVMIRPEDASQLITQIYQKAHRAIGQVEETGDDDFSFSIGGLSRFRVSTYKQRNTLAAVIRVVPFGIPDYRKLNIPDSVMTVAERSKGMVIVTGPAGEGKSTTMACLIDRINHTRSGHIITLEQPIEYLHRNDRCIISQREITSDTATYVTALRACLRQAPDVILVGEMRDFETIQTAMTAAETGHLVISTLHTVGAANSIDRIIDVFPPEQQQQIRIQLSMTLESVISQQLLPDVDGGRIPAFEIMNVNAAVKNMIREGKIHQLDSTIAASSGEGMQSMDASILELYQKRRITKEVALRYALNPSILQRKLL